MTTNVNVWDSEREGRIVWEAFGDDGVLTAEGHVEPCGPAMVVRLDHGAEPGSDVRRAVARAARDLEALPPSQAPEEECENCWRVLPLASLVDVDEGEGDEAHLWCQACVKENG